jgi:hypothetical protein
MLLLFVAMSLPGLFVVLSLGIVVHRLTPHTPPFLSGGGVRESQNQAN